MSIFRTLLMQKRGGDAELVFIQDENDANLRPRWGGVLHSTSETLASNSPASTQSSVSLLSKTGGVVSSNWTLVGSLDKFPRYIAYYKYSIGSFPIAHIGAYWKLNNSLGFYGSHPLRNISSQRKHIFDLQEISQLVPSATPSGTPLLEKGLAFRTGASYGCIVGCDDLKTLQDYLNSIP